MWHQSVRGLQTQSRSSSSASLSAAISLLTSRLQPFDKPRCLEQLVASGAAPPHLAALKRAAVLVPLSVVEDERRLVFMLCKRSGSLRAHSGEVCFPGGRVDAQDADAVATACREAREEANVQRAQLTVLAQLCPFITFGRVLVTPVVALLDKSAFAPKLNATEVDMLFELPVERFLSARGHRHEVVRNEAGDYHLHYFRDNVRPLARHSQSTEHTTTTSPVLTWGLTAFVATLVSSIVNAREPDFDVGGNMRLTDPHLSHTLHQVLLRKLAVADAHHKNQ